jgi:hypothetical protein
MTSILPGLLSNGAGRWFALCDRCGRSSPTWPTCDPLRVLAVAQAAGWRAVRREDGGHVLTCPRCGGGCR